MTVSHGPGNSAYRVGISPDGARTISSGFDGKLRLADAATGDELLTVHIGGSFLYCAGFSPDGVYMVGGGKNPRVMLAGTKTRVATLKGHRHNVNNARFSPDSARVATGSGDSYTPADYTVRVWDVQTGAPQQKVKLPEVVQDLRWVDDDVIVALAGDALHWIDVTSGAITARVALPFSCESIDRAGSTIIAANEYGGGGLLLDVDTGATITLAPALPEPKGGLQVMTRCVAAAADGQRFAAGLTYRDYGDPPEWCIGIVWSASGEELTRFRWRGDFFHDLVFTPDGESIITSDGDGAQRRWDVARGEQVW
ncbi:MAG: WD40 repeat domain-containing protein [Myxococcales bacterium]|nr:WD40 repeat domain-containing protein [Myxococcales bacterium]